MSFSLSTQEILTILLLGFCAGVLSGMFGIGGGLVIVPILVVVFGLSQKQATGTSLFALLLPVGLLAVLQYWKQGQARLDYGLIIAVGIFFGAYLGSRITLGLSDLAMKRIYAGFLIVVSAYYLYASSEKGQKVLRPGMQETPEAST